MRGQVSWVVGAHRGRAEPEIPMDIRRDRNWCWGQRTPGPNGADPVVDFANRTNNAAPHQLHHTAIIFLGVDLGSHLRHAFVFARGFGDQAGLRNRVGQGLLAIDVQSTAQGHHRCRRMDVIGGADDDGIEVISLEKLAEIVIALG